MADELKKRIEELKKKKKWPSYTYAPGEQRPVPPPRFTGTGVDTFREAAKQGLDFGATAAKTAIVPPIVRGPQMAMDAIGPEGTEAIKKSVEPLREVWFGPEERLKDKDILAAAQAAAETAPDAKADENKEGTGTGLGDIGPPPDPSKYLMPLIKAKQQMLDEASQNAPAMSTWEEEVQATRQWAEEQKNNLDKRELTETLVQAVGQLAAGLYGLKHGMDMSGLEFNKTDWQAKLADLRGETQSKLSETDKREALRSRVEDKWERRKESYQGDLEQLKGRLAGEQYQREMAIWEALQRQRAAQAKAMSSGTITISEANSALKTKEEELKTAQTALKDLEDDDLQGATDKLRSILPASLIEKASDTGYFDFTSDEESLRSLIENHLEVQRQDTDRMRRGIQLNAQGKALVYSPEFAKRNPQSGGWVGVPKNQLEALRSQDPNMRVYMLIGDTNSAAGGGEE